MSIDKNNPVVSVLIPTYNRVVALVATLGSLWQQTFLNFEIIIADQGDASIADDATVQTLIRLLSRRGISCFIYRNLPRRGIAQQRQYLLSKSNRRYVLFLDDDVVLEPDALHIMVTAIAAERCGFVGMALIGLSYTQDRRPAEQAITLWDGPVAPERVRPGSPAWQRYKLHNAANLLHVAEQFKDNSNPYITYKVAWVGGCVLYRRLALCAVGGFEFWQALPTDHCGEDVLAQLRVMEHFGGCGLLPSRAYHQEQPTTLPDRSFNAPEHLLPSDNS